ncbi:MAG: MBL fold metallo-hydrolase [Akkermansiaceae bacterium]|nr:MBL fold metallo-hydrolase [Akkermansiaceae bacterium]
MKIHFCGAAGTTTGSQHLLEINGKRILLDCGLYQGHRADELRINRDFPYFDPSTLDHVILSHAHIDHSGNIPNLIKKGYKGNVYCTHATRSLCSVMLVDAARIQEHDCNFLNKMHRRRGGSGSVGEVIYTEDDARRSLDSFVALSYGRRMYLDEGIALTFYDAGHILGSAQIVLDIEDKEDGRRKRLLFSGDVGRGGNELLRDPEPVPGVDIMLMESTYGGRHHEAPARDDAAFYAAITEALERGGNVYIPAFAVERTQQLLYLLNRAFREGQLPHQTHVFVDSPMAVSATEFFRSHAECLNSEVFSSLFESRDPFSFANLHMCRTISESQMINEKKSANIIISASGMCEAGRILHHLKLGITDPKNTILFVGFCAANTLGRRIIDGAKEVPILGGFYPVRATVKTLDSFSGHADHSELLEYFERTGGSKSRVFLVHGEPDSAQALSKALAARHSQEIHIAKQNESITC